MMHFLNVYGQLIIGLVVAVVTFFLLVAVEDWIVATIMAEVIGQSGLIQ
jgi:hypothetical protein